MADWRAADLLPGLYLALLALVLVRFLARHDRPLPRAYLALVAVAIAALFAPVLLGGRLLLPLDNLPAKVPFRQLEHSAPRGNSLHSDPLLQMAPWRHQVRGFYAAGEWPLWNPLAGAGEPLLANPQAQALAPIERLADVLPAAGGPGLAAALKVTVALLFGFAFLRRAGCPPVAAAAGAAAFGLGGFLLLWLTWPLSTSAALLPAVLFALLVALERRRPRDAVLLAATVFALAAAGHPETIALALALAAAVAARRAWTLPPAARLPALAVAASGVALGGLLAAPALLPTAHILPDSLRHQAIEQRLERIDAGAFPGWSAETPAAMARRTLPTVAPNAWGNNRYRHYWGYRNSNHDAAGFVGSAALLAALLAFWPGLARRPGERLAAAVLLASVIVAAQPPGLAKVLAALPVAGRTVGLSRISLLTAACLAYLAACTWSRWQAGALPRKPVWTLGALGAALIAAPYLVQIGKPLPGLRWGTLAVQLTVVAASAWLLSAARGRRLRWLLLLLVVPELLLIHGPANPPMPRRLDFPETPTLAFLRQQLGDQRLVGLGWTLPPNLAGRYGLADIRSSNPIKPAAMRHLLAPLVRGAPSTTDIIDTEEHPLYAMLGVRYVLVPRARAMPAPWQLAFRRPDGWVYRRPRTLGRLFLPHSARPYHGQRWRLMIGAIGNFRARSLVETPPDAPSAVWKAAAPRLGTIAGSTRTPTRVQATVALPERRLLASSIYQDGGWRLLVDGERQPTVRVNGPLLGAWLNAGRARIDLVYRPPGLLAGAALAGLALAVLAALATPPPGGRRLSSHPR